MRPMRIVQEFYSLKAMRTQLWTELGIAQPTTQPLSLPKVCANDPAAS